MLFIEGFLTDMVSKGVNLGIIPEKTLTIKAVLHLFINVQIQRFTNLIAIHIYYVLILINW